MVNKVDGNNYYVYTKQKKIDIPDTGEKFNLDYKQGETSSEAKNKDEISEEQKQQTAERLGVRLELSNNGRNADAERRKQEETSKTQSAPAQMPLLETIRTYIVSAITAIREFFHNIWNDEPQQGTVQDVLEETVQDGLLDASQEAVTDEFRESIKEAGQEIPRQAVNGLEEIIDASDERSVLAMDEERRNREIQQSLRNGDMEQVISLLTENGKRTVAKNSTLLTSYDKNGRVVEPNASDRQRALYGDKNTLKL